MITITISRECRSKIEQLSVRTMNIGKLQTTATMTLKLHIHGFTDGCAEREGEIDPPGI